MQASDFTLITAAEYLTLDNPEFEGQTGVRDNHYYMFWSCNGRLVKTRQQLVPDYLLDRATWPATHGGMLVDSRSPLSPDEQLEQLHEATANL